MTVELKPEKDADGTVRQNRTTRIPQKRSKADGQREIRDIHNRKDSINCETARSSHASSIPKNIPFAVIRRRVTAELLDLTCLAACFLSSGGRSGLRPMFAPSNTSMALAIRRLAKSGLIACRRPRGQSPLLSVTAEGLSRASDILWPERFWDRHWDGCWYVLMYDVPETERAYRSALQCFFRRERMGCIQKSVWISARDIRPLFDDLDQAAAIRDYAIILQASPVLGQTAKQLAAQAWDFENLAKRQSDYLNACVKRTNQPSSTLKPSMALEAARSELLEYRVLMQSDPLLPKELLPDDYAGRQVIAAFRSRLLALVGKIFSL